MKKLPNYKGTKTLTDNLKLGDYVVCNATHNSPKIAGWVTELPNADRRVTVTVDKETSSKTAADSYVFPESAQLATHDIIYVNGHINYAQFFGGCESHPELPFCVDTATELQVSGQIEDTEIHRQVFEHFATYAAMTHGDLVGEYARQVNMAVEDLVRLGKYSLIGRIARDMLRTAAIPATEYLQIANPSSADNTQYSMALHNKIFAKFAALGRQEMFQYLNQEGIDFLMADFLEDAPILK